MFKINSIIRGEKIIKLFDIVQMLKYIYIYRIKCTIVDIIFHYIFIRKLSIYSPQKINKYSCIK